MYYSDAFIQQRIEFVFFLMICSGTVSQQMSSAPVLFNGLLNLWTSFFPTQRSKVRERLKTLYTISQIENIPFPKVHGRQRKFCYFESLVISNYSQYDSNNKISINQEIQLYLRANCEHRIESYWRGQKHYLVNYG